jgi:cobalt-zinc-cadmium efflux system membrane fusion protein
MAIMSLQILAVAAFSGCRKSENLNTARASAESTSKAGQSEAAIQLSPSQLNAIKIERVENHFFPVEREAVGSVSFDEDPAIVQAESTLIGAVAALHLANKTLARLQELGTTNGIAQKDLEQAVSTQVTAEAALKATRDAVRALGKADMEIDAMIATGKIPPAPEAKRWVISNVPESDSPLLRVGQRVQVKATAFPDRFFDGNISRVYGTIDPNMHRVTIRCEIGDSNNELRPGMLADVFIRVQEPVEAAALPADGLVRESDGTMTAWVTTDRHQFVQKIVKTGLRADGRVQIIDGLQRGELAVTEGAVFLSNLLNAPPSD